MEWSAFHTLYYRLLDLFAAGTIRRLMITVPPQHGKSTASSVMLPAYLLGLDPDRRIAIASYSASLAQKFNKRAQRIMEQPFYTELFPETVIKGSGSRSNSYIRTAEQVEVIGRDGSLTAVGREGPLTGNAVDTFIIDDLYKDAMEANSPVVRENCWEWYTSVVRTRQHNRSQELIVFTRWHNEDLIGTITEREKVVELTSWAQLDSPDPACWYLLNLEALKESPTTELDPRQRGEALWPSRHSTELLQEKRRLDPLRFESMYQGHPSDAAGLLYGDRFMGYSKLPTDIIRRGNYTDTADTGDDYLCSVCYSVGDDELVYIEDVLYSREGMEVTEPLMAEMLLRNGAIDAVVESNNGGRGFARNVQRLAPKVNVAWFHQSANKEARILSNSSSVVSSLRFPQDWRERWPDFAAHLMSYNRRFRSNRWHDAADVLTGIIETECTKVLKKRIYNSSFKIRNYAYPKE